MRSAGRGGWERLLFERAREEQSRIVAPMPEMSQGAANLAVGKREANELACWRLVQA